MITVQQKRLVGASGLPTLLSMWEQRRRWWFNHLMGDADREALAAARAAKLHAKMVETVGIPDLLVRQWEDQWDEWFQKHLKFMERGHA